MPHGEERKADHIAESYEDRGVSEKKAERRAWATVNKDLQRLFNPTKRLPAQGR